MSISLTNAATISINGAITESDASAALQYIEINYPIEVRLFYSFGSFNSGNQVFTPGNNFPRIMVTISLRNGTWATSNGLSGTLAAGALSSLQTAVVNLQNAFETFGVNQSILVGTQVPWVASTEL